MSTHLRDKAYKLLMGLVLMSTFSCESIDDDRIPWAPVHMPFTNALWTSQIRPAALVHHRFIKESVTPSWYPYTELSQTGYGGLLLVIDYSNTPVAYDLSCPYEARRDVLIEVDPETNLARCPKCHSTYFIFENHGQPESGPAAHDHYGLRRYSVNGPSTTGIDYYTIRN